MDLQQIGAHHPLVKRVVDVARNTAPNPHRLVIADGLWANNAVLEAGVAIDTFLFCPEAVYGDEARMRAPQLAERARRSYQISLKTMVRLSVRDRPDGLLSLAELPRWTMDDLPVRRSMLVVVADGIEIPGNLGTLIRTLDGCAADALILTNRRTRLTHPKVFRGSHGANLTLPTVTVETVHEAADWLATNGFAVHLADTSARLTYREIRYAPRTAIVVGGERYGLAPAWYGRGFGAVRVPMLGSADSLNVAISASILAYEARAHIGRT